jgi:hypothetical protein
VTGVQTCALPISSNRVPGPCLTITQIFHPCIGAAWRLKRAPMSISTMDAIAVLACCELAVDPAGSRSDFHRSLVF